MASLSTSDAATFSKSGCESRVGMSADHDEPCEHVGILPLPLTFNGVGAKPATGNLAIVAECSFLAAAGDPKLPLLPLNINSG